MNVTAAPANMTSLDLYFQALAPDGTTWFDFYHFTQFTSVTSKYYSFRPAGSWEFTPQTAGLGAQLTNTINLPGKMRAQIVFVNAGAGNAQFALDMEFFRRRGIGGSCLNADTALHNLQQLGPSEWGSGRTKPCDLNVSHRF